MFFCRHNGKNIVEKKNIVVYLITRISVVSTEKPDDTSRFFDDTEKSINQNVIFGQFLKIQLSPDISSTQSKKKYPHLPP